MEKQPMRLADLDATAIYLQEMGRFPVPTPQEQIALATTIQKGKYAARRLTSPRTLLSLPEKIRLRDQYDAGEAARKEMTERNLRLVVSTAKHFIDRGMPFLDLIEIGNFGLLHAVDKFDVRKGFRFSTYAVTCIRRKITRALADQDQTIDIPFDDTHTERALQNNPDYLDSIIQHEQINHALNSLSPRNARILQLHYGINGYPEHNKAEVGRKLGITRERVRKIEEDVLTELSRIL